MRTRRTTKTRSNSSNKRNTTNNNAHKTNRSCLTKSNLQRNTFLVGMAVSSALVLTRPLMPAVLYAATITNTYDWTKQNLAGVGDLGINNVAMSADGSTLIASSWDRFGGGADYQPTLANNPLYLSKNAGASWQNVTETVDQDGINFWSSVDVSNDGQTMVALSADVYDFTTEEYLSGKLFISQNAGTTWADITAGIPPLQGGEPEAVISGDGSTLVVAENDSDDAVFISENNGDSWSSAEISDVDLNGSPRYLSISDNGDKLLVGMNDSGSELNQVFITDDKGTTWTGITPPVENVKLALTAMSADGSKLSVATLESSGGEDINASVFVSSNDGQTWTDATPAGAADDSVWSSIAMSDDGNTLAVFGVDLDFEALSQGGEEMPSAMYVSRNGGTNWTQEDHREDGNDIDYKNYYYSTLDLNSTGSQIILGSIEGIYTGTAQASSGPSTTLTNAETGKPVVLSIPAGTSLTCQTTFKEAGLAVADPAFGYPLGLVDFCFSGAQASNDVTFTFVTDLKARDLVARKYSTTNKSYTTIDGATITDTTYQGQPAVQITYTIEDNGPLDLNPVTGEVSDPVGLAVADITPPATGIAPANSTNPRLATLLTGIAITAGFLIIPIRRIVGKLTSGKVTSGK